MALDFNQLSFSVAKELAAVYLVSGDEPLQQSEAVDLIRQKARSEGFLNREVLHVEGKFDWNQLFAACLNQSLFAEKNLIELNLPTAKPGRDGSAAIEKVIAELSADNLLIIIAGKVDKPSQSTKWFKSIVQKGIVVQVWPLLGHKLDQWLTQRLQRKGMKTNQQCIKLLADSVEGNLLAAAQEVEKLLALFGPTQLSVDDILGAVSDNARYDVFKLSDSLLAGNSARSVQVLKGLRGEKLATPVILWALLRELRVLASMSFEKKTTGRTDASFKKYRVWDSKKAQYLQALSRGNLIQWQGLIKACATAERMIKGAEAGDEWDVIEQICLAACQPKLLKQGDLVAV
ncbi:MAG: DNA polymerase III subunit delta [Cycloclasticus sp.]|nr:DNA polymerase III subunit delta [Cycloclasticus sp.]